MRKAFGKLGLGSNDKLVTTANSGPALPPNKPQVVLDSKLRPTQRDLYRYRKQYGVNLGAWFVGEKWIAHHLYSCCSEEYSSELSAVLGHLKQHGLESTKQVWESHWDTWIGDSDLAYLRSKGINSVRLPIGWYCLSQSALLQGTDFETVAGVYLDCWSRIMAFIARCADFGIGVLVDLHCLPGGANGDSHSGTDSKSSKFFTSSKNRSKAVECVKYIIDQVSHFDHIVGVQVINEPAWGTEDKCASYYEQCISYAQAHGAGLPIYISDAWNLEHWSTWLSRRSKDEFVVIDHHYYHCFTPADHSRNVRDHVRDLMGDEKQLENCSLELNAGEGNIVVGEWSCALNPTSKDGFSQTELRAEMKRFGRSQAQIYGGAYSGGFWFWTYKFQDRNHQNEWDIRDMLETGILPSPLSMCRPLSKSTKDDIVSTMEDIKDQKFAEHCAYWDARGSQFEHWRYLDGFTLGMKDSLAFATPSSSSKSPLLSSTIGFTSRWMHVRLQGHIREKGTSRLNCEWEFETGYKLALTTFREVEKQVMH